MFNYTEGAFWVAIGALIFLLCKKAPTKFFHLARYSSFVLVLFGLSDLVEARVGSFFEPGLLWLFVWKALGVVGLLAIIPWYLWLQLKK